MKSVSSICRPKAPPGTEAGCDPDVFDEHVGGEVATDPRGDALAFVIEWDNTTGWSDAERWGRLEAFRELRKALETWDGRSEPPAALCRGLAAGLARTRNMKSDAHVATALAPEPGLRDLVGAALATQPAAGQDERGWLVTLDARWAEGATWRDLGRAVEVPEEFTGVVYVYTGLRRPGALQYRELRRRDFEARFGVGAPRAPARRPAADLPDRPELRGRPWLTRASSRPRGSPRG